MEAGLPAERLTRSRPAPGVGIVHLGLGAFFRAHGAIYIAEAVAASGGDWGIVGVSLRSPGMRDALAPQGFAYTAVELGPEGETAEVVEVVRNVLVAREDPGAVLAAMADPDVRIVTLTVTEKGYCYQPANRQLDLTHPDIAHDLAHPLPRSAPGFLVRALEHRRAAGLRPFTVLTCDNLPSNGHLVRGIVLDLARAIDIGLADWIAAEARFPGTMVDRIVPATTSDDIAKVERLTGRSDAAPVLHEPFRQWVVEDDFVGGARPELGAVGVELVGDVTPYEHMKLRMLNGTHSALAYLGFLAGHETVADTVADPVFATFVRSLWAREIIPAIEAPPGVDLAAYAEALLDRYQNPAIRHRTWQIAMDGSQKLPQRLLGTIADGLEAGRPVSGLCLAVAGWMRYVGGTDETGSPIDVRDPMAGRLRALAEEADPVTALLGVREVFPGPLAARLAEPVAEAYARLEAVGARGAVAEFGGVA